MITKDWLDTQEQRAQMAAEVRMPGDDFLALIAAARNGLTPKDATDWKAKAEAAEKRAAEAEAALKQAQSRIQMFEDALGASTRSVYTVPPPLAKAATAEPAAPRQQGQGDSVPWRRSATEPDWAERLEHHHREIARLTSKTPATD